MAAPQQNLTRKQDTGLADYDGLTPHQQGLLVRQFEYLLRSGALPKHMRTAQQLFLAYKLLRPLGLDVIINLRNLWQNPQTGSFELCNDAPLAACQSRRSEYVGTAEWHVNAKNERRTVDNFIGFKAEGAVCVAKRKGREDCIGLYTMEQARAAGLTTKDNWRKHPEAMLTKRARAIALRQQWSDVLGGVGIHEADDFVAPAASLRDQDLASSMLRRVNEQAEAQRDRETAERAARAVPAVLTPAEKALAKRADKELAAIRRAGDAERAAAAKAPAPTSAPEIAKAPPDEDSKVVDADHDLDDDLDVIFGNDAPDEREPGADD